jgi:hypothetical protein
MTENFGGHLLNWPHLGQSFRDLICHGLPFSHSDQASGKKTPWGGARENSGPKGLRAAYRRRRTAIVRLTDREKKALRHAAKQARTDFSEWMRQVLLAHASTA